MTKPPVKKIRSSGPGQPVKIGTEELPLAPSVGLVNHSPTGFAWGYSGSGPSQLALALLYHYTKDRTYALRGYQLFKEEVVAKWPQDKLNVPETVVTDWIEAHP
jgi:Family of unknown function (DUF6166)